MPRNGKTEIRAMSPGHTKKRVGFKKTHARLLKQLIDRKSSVRANAVKSLAQINHPRVVTEIIKALNDTNPNVRSVAAECLGSMNSKRAIRALITRLPDHFSEVRMRAAESLGVLLAGQKKSPVALIRSLRDPDELVRIEVADSLGAIGDRAAAPALWRAIHDRSPLVRSYAAGAIGELGERGDMARLEREVRREGSELSRVGYYQALYMLGKEEGLSELVKLLTSKSYRVRCASARTLCDFEVSRSNASALVRTLRIALKKETTTAGRSSIQASIRTIRRQFSKHQ